MKQPWIFPLTALGGGFAAFVLRLTQNRTGFESGLPVPGCPAATALFLLLAALGVVTALLARRLSGPGVLPAPADSAAFLLLPALGCFLLTLSGAADLYEGLTGASLLGQLRDRFSSSLIPSGYFDPVNVLLSSSDARMSALLQSLCGILLIGGAWGMLCFLSLFRPGSTRDRQTFPNQVLLLMPVSQVTRLLVFYRKDCVNPILEEYVVDLLSLIFLTLGFFALISFQFRQGSFPRMAFYAVCGTVLCVCALADRAEYLSSLLLNLGTPLVLLGFLILFLWAGELVPGREVSGSGTGGKKAEPEAG